MGALRSLSKGAAALRPLVNVVRGVEKSARDVAALSVLDGQPAATARLREVLGLPADGGVAAAGPLIYVAVAGHDPTLAAAVLAGAKREGRRVLALVIGTHDERAELEAELLCHPPLELSNIAHVVSLESADAVLTTIARLLGTEALAAARAHPPLRDAVAEALIAQMSRQAGTVGVAAVVPGADLPVITLIQVRLVAQLAAIYGRPLDARRGLEIAGVLAGAFGWRAVARRVVASVPVAGFALRGGVAFSATRAVGEASKAYFAKAGDRADLPLDGLASALNGALKQRKGRE